MLNYQRVYTWILALLQTHNTHSLRNPDLFYSFFGSHRGVLVIVMAFQKWVRSPPKPPLPKHFVYHEDSLAIYSIHTLFVEHNSSAPGWVQWQCVRFDASSVCEAFIEAHVTEILQKQCWGFERLCPSGTSMTVSSRYHSQWGIWLRLDSIYNICTKPQWFIHIIYIYNIYNI